MQDVSRRLTGRFHFQLASFSSTFPTINATSDQSSFLLKTKFLGLDEVKGHTLDLFSIKCLNSVCTSGWFAVAVAVGRSDVSATVWSLCRYERCGNTATRDGVQFSRRVLAEVSHTLSGRTLVLVISGLDVVVVRGVVSASGRASIKLIQID